MIKSETPVAEFAEKFELPEKIVKPCLYSSSTGNPTPSQLALKILEDSPEAKELGMRNGGRLYDEIISRKQFKEFPKGKNTLQGSG